MRRLFAYQVGSEHGRPAPGCRVRVPFGGRTLIGVVLEPGAPEEVPGADLKSVIDVLDREPLFPARHLELLRWCAGYYH